MKRKLWFLTFILLFILSGCKDDYQAFYNKELAASLKEEFPETIMLLGASFANKDNGWFEITCSQLGIRGINKAIGGEAIYHTARRMAAGKQYTIKELDEIDLLVLMHVHNQNVISSPNLKENYLDYGDFENNYNYAEAFDYVIKKYKADCAALEFNPESKYYGKKNGKPAKIILCTHWHDSRTLYNSTVRQLAEKWDIPLVEFDSNIGFSKNDAGNKDPGEPSRKVAKDTEIIDGVEYGWHPKRGAKEYIQRKISSIFLEKLLSEYNFEGELTDDI